MSSQARPQARSWLDNTGLVLPKSSRGLTAETTEKGQDR